MREGGRSPPWLYETCLGFNGKINLCILIVLFIYPFCVPAESEDFRFGSSVDLGASCCHTHPGARFSRAFLARGQVSCSFPPDRGPMLISLVLAAESVHTHRRNSFSPMTSCFSGTAQFFFSFCSKLFSAPGEL
jgi:hypothetical protein